MVQNTKKSWVITGFKEVAPNSTIKIYGLIDFPSTSGTIGNGMIITYSNMH